MTLAPFLRKLLYGALTILLGAGVVFVAMRVLPGDPAMRLLAGGGQTVTVEQLEEVRRQWGLDQPLPVQFFAFLYNALQFDFGVSSHSGQPVSAIIGTRLPVTLQLAAFSIIFAAVLGVIAGTIAAYRRGRSADYVVSSISVLGISVPNFWLGLMLILVFAVNLRWLPASGFVPFFEDPIGAIRSMLMPTIVVGSGLAAMLMRQVRSSMIEQLSADYVRTARSKRLSEPRVVVRHALRNTYVTITSVVGLQLGSLLSGAIVAEQLFVIPGLGKGLLDAVLARDYNVVQAIALISIVAYVLISLVCDALYYFFDPRLRRSAAE